MKHTLFMALLVALPVALLPVRVVAQTTESIAEELLENAYSVIRNHDVEFTCESTKNGVLKESKTVSILNEKGSNAGDFVVFCDKFTSLHKFSGEVFDATGRSIRKIKKSDLQMSEYSAGLSTDDYVYFYKCTAPYPYTVKYEWEIRRKDGIISYPHFYPQRQFNQSVEKAAYRLTAATGIEPRHRSFNTDRKPTETKVPGGTLYELSFTNLKAFEQEFLGPRITQLVPYAYFNPTDFFFEGTQGSLASWQDYGVWAHKLQQGRDALPPQFQDKIKEMTANCSSDRERVEVLYNYLAENTRYVSIQLGIGGLQPMAAADVHKTGFGDCKGLSNYMKAMLAVLGIPAVYTEISMDHARILKDYVSLNQTNHVILQVPLPADTLWLECTNATLPFGYAHQGIAGHDAILITPEGGKFCTLPSYPGELNTQTNHASISIDADGQATVANTQTAHLFQYEATEHISKLNPDKRRDFLKSSLSLPRATVSDVQINEQKAPIPSIAVTYRVTTPQYGNKTGNRLFIPINIFRNKFRNLPSKKRRHDIHQNYAYLDTDSISITLPEGYTVESLPKSLNLETNYGTFQSSYRIEEGVLHILHRYQVHKGKFDKEEYENFRAFYNAVSGQYGGKVVLRKE